MESSTERQPENRAVSGPLIRVDYQDEAGRMWAVLMPNNDNSHPSMGIPIGPPDLSSLGLPEETAVRLHNQLFYRSILTKQDMKRKHKELFAALQAAYRVDVTKVTELFD